VDERGNDEGEERGAEAEAAEAAVAPATRGGGFSGGRGHGGKRRGSPANVDPPTHCLVAGDDVLFYLFFLFIYMFFKLRGRSVFILLVGARTAEAEASSFDYVNQDRRRSFVLLLIKGVP
jgi:hypothetical protein